MLFQVYWVKHIYEYIFMYFDTAILREKFYWYNLAWLWYGCFYKNMNNTQFTTYGMLVIRTYQGQTIYTCLGSGHETMVCIVYS